MHALLALCLRTAKHSLEQPGQALAASLQALPGRIALLQPGSLTARRSGSLRWSLLISRPSCGGARLISGAPGMAAGAEAVGLLHCVAPSDPVDEILGQLRLQNLLVRCSAASCTPAAGSGRSSQPQHAQALLQCCKQLRNALLSAHQKTWKAAGERSQLAAWSAAQLCSQQTPG